MNTTLSFQATVRRFVAALPISSSTSSRKARSPALITALLATLGTFAAGALVVGCQEDASSPSPMSPPPPTLRPPAPTPPPPEPKPSANAEAPVPQRPSSSSQGVVAFSVAPSVAPTLPQRAEEGSPEGGEQPDGSTPRDPDCQQLAPSISATAASSTSITVSWNAQVSFSCDNTFTLSGGNLSSSTVDLSGTETDTGLTAGTQYCYTIDGGDRGSASDCATPTKPPMCAPFISATAGVESVTVTWSDSAGCTTTISGGNLDGDESSPATDTGLTCKQSYTYTVTASRSGYTTKTASDSATPTCPPDPPDPPCNAPNLTVTALSCSSIKLVWTDSSTNGCTTTITPALRNDTTSPVIVRGLSEDTTYTYTATADGPHHEKSTDTDSATTRECDITPPPTGPSAPSNFTAATASAFSIDLEWNAVSGADSYEVRHREADGAWESWTDVGSVTAYTVSSLEADTEYDFQVRTVDGSDRSSAVTDSATTDIDAPTSFEAEAVADDEVELTWDAYDGADSYEVRYREAEGTWEDWTDVGSVTAYDVTGLSATTDYEFEVRAVDGTERSAARLAEATTLAGPPPTGLTAVATSLTSIRTSWDAVSGTDVYTVRRVPTDRGDPPSTRGSNRETYIEYTALTKAREYCFAVRAEVSSGAWTEWSAEVCEYTWGRPPANLRATAIGSDSVDLAWDAALGATGYQVSGPTEEVDVSGTTHTWGSLSGAGPHTFRVRASYSSMETSRRGGRLKVTLPSLTAPSNLAGTATSSSVSLTWDAGGGAGSWTSPEGSGSQELEYRVERRSPPGSGTWSAVASGLSDEEYTDTGLAPDTKYEYQAVTTVAASDGELASDASTALTVTTLPPPAPALTAVAGSSVSVELSWTATPGAGSYEFEWSPDGVNWNGPESAGSGTSHEHGGRDPEVAYTYRLRAQDAKGGALTEWSAPASATTPALETPAGLALGADSATAVTVDWDAVPAATGYEVERQEAGESAESPVAVSGPSHPDTGLAWETEYRYRVRSVLVRGSDRWASEWSQPETVTTLHPVMDLRVAALTSVTVEMTWEATAGSPAHSIEWSTDGGSQWSGPLTPAPSSGSSWRYQHTGRDPETTYSYRVRVVDTTGTAVSSWTAPASATTPALEAPENLAAEADSATEVSVSWDGVAAATGYELERESGGTTKPAVSLSAVEYGETGLTANTTYVYRVRSVLARGGTTWRSGWSSVSVTTADDAPDPPTGVTAGEASDGTVYLDWAAAANADSYEMRWRATGGSWSDPVSAGKGTSFEYDGVTGTAPYEYQLRSVAGARRSDWVQAEIFLDK